MKIFEKIKRREFLRKVSLGTAALILPKLASSQISRPNVIFVLTDDQGYGDLGCHGNEIIKTPNLDRLHHQSMRLTNFHVSPTCAPTRASLMTGRYNNRTGVWHTIMGRSLLREDEVTIADVLKNNDYNLDGSPFKKGDNGIEIEPENNETHTIKNCPKHAANLKKRCLPSESILYCLAGNLLK